MPKFGFTDMAHYYLLFDDSCGVCRASVSRLSSRVNPAIVHMMPISKGSELLKQSRLNYDEVMRQIHLLGPEGEIWRGADAIAEVLILSEKGKWVGKLIRIWGIRILVGWGYRLIARLRHLIS